MNKKAKKFEETEVFKQETIVNNQFNKAIFIDQLHCTLNDKVFKHLIDPRHRKQGEHIRVTITMHVREEAI